MHVHILIFGNTFCCRALDYDSLQVKLYDFTVTATDNGDIQRTGVAAVRIFLTNVNDEKPVFTENMTADVRYNAPVETEIYQAKATDADGDCVKYRFVSSKYSLLLILLLLQKFLAKSACISLLIFSLIYLKFLIENFRLPKVSN